MVEDKIMHSAGDVKNAAEILCRCRSQPKELLRKARVDAANDGKADGVIEIRRDEQFRALVGPVITVKFGHQFDDSFPLKAHR